MPITDERYLQEVYLATPPGHVSEEELSSILQDAMALIGLDERLNQSGAVPSSPTVRSLGQALSDLRRMESGLREESEWPPTVELVDPCETGVLLRIRGDVPRTAISHVDSSFVLPLCGSVTPRFIEGSVDGGHDGRTGASNAVQRVGSAVKRCARQLGRLAMMVTAAAFAVVLLGCVFSGLTSSQRSLEQLHRSCFGSMFLAKKTLS